MSRKWTEAQNNAINARDMQILVSAAAGSGKTSVLTERVKSILCDVENPCSVSQLLVVTFTRAAAAEMRDRIYKAICKEMEKNRENSDYLRKQMLLLPTADICTIDSFCAKLVRENFHLADVCSDFRILDEKDEKELMKSAVKDVIDKLYEENSEAFIALSSIFVSERDDVRLEEVIEQLYNYSRAYPNPFLWLDEVVERFSPEKLPIDTGLTEIIFKHLSLFADFHCSRLLRCEAMLEESGNFDTNYLSRFLLSAENLKALKQLCGNSDWEGVVNLIRNGIVVRPASRNKNVDKELQALTDKVFKDFDDGVSSLVKACLPLNSEHNSDCITLYPMVKVLCEAVKRLTLSLEASKKEKNAYGFDDILHKAVDLLVEYKDDSEVKTPLALELESKYKEILIDEYQDTNEAQNKIFEIISKNKNNLYTVGDVKQSIYGFRLASPGLFMAMKDSLCDYNGEVQPSQITLENNFRSREGITQAVNYIFKNIMSRTVGEIDYNEREFLNYSAEFEEKSTADVGVLCINADKSDDNSPTEAQVIAKYIDSIVKSGATVKGSEGVRKATWGDFCILLRSTKNKVALYAEELKRLSIPVSASTDADCTNSKEIEFLISLIKVINNPLLDIPLISVLISPVFGFTPDELAQIRMIDKKSDFYVCLLKYSEASKKAKDFISKIQMFRNISVSHSIYEFVRLVIEDLFIADIYYAAGEGEIRDANIKGFLKLASDFTESGRSGLNDFVRYMDIAAENGALKSFNKNSAADNSVKIMSIHKSKGLEFPYVIIAECSKDINRLDAYKQLTLSRDTGVGIKIKDDVRFTKYHSLSSVATEKSVLFNTISEELRVLYVAMTRAKEHLTFVCNVANKALLSRVKLNHIFTASGEVSMNPYAVYKAKSFSELVLSCLSHHRDGGIIRDLCNIPPQSFEDEAMFSFDCSYIDSADFDFSLNKDNKLTAQVNFELLRKLKENIDYQYPYDYSGVLAKRTASSTEKTNSNRKYFASAQPKFLDKQFSGAERGTVVHKFLELCDFNSAISDFEAECNHLLSRGVMTEYELKSVDEKAVNGFLASEIGERLLASDKVMKEYEFSVLRKASDFYNELPPDSDEEEIVVQGKLDCAFLEKDGFVLLDYKTDGATTEAYYLETYTNQIKIYAQALEECTGVPVKESYIYSFKLNKFIKL